MMTLHKGRVLQHLNHELLVCICFLVHSPAPYRFRYHLRYYFPLLLVFQIVWDSGGQQMNSAVGDCRRFRDTETPPPWLQLYGLSPKLWTHLKRASVQGGVPYRRDNAILTIQRTKPHCRNGEAFCLWDAVINDSFTLVPLIYRVLRCALHMSNQPNLG